MSLLVDYRCSGCGTSTEHWVPSPPPAATDCAACGARSRRLFAAVGLGRRSDDPVPASAPGVPPAARKPSLCQRFPQIPGLCHMTKSAQRRWVAAYQRDHRALDGEIARQERAAKEKLPDMTDAITHHHRP